MAVIGKIREKSSLVLIIVGIAMLAFLLPSEGIRNLFGGADNSIGEIGGEKVAGQDFDQKLQQNIARWETQNGQTAPAQVRESLKDQVWNEIIQETVLESQFKELGISVSSDELFDMIQGENPHPQIQQSFTDPNTGAFDKSRLIQFLKGLETLPPANKNQWFLFEEGIEKERVAAKYNTLFTKGLSATSNLIKDAYTEQNEKRTLQFVAKRYNTVHDSTITLSEEELKAYYNEHKNEYKQETSREIEYVKFYVAPSEEDVNEAKNWVKNIAKEFQLAENDSSFVVYNSDPEEPLDETFYGQGELPAGIDSSFFDNEVGAITPVYELNSTFRVTKLSEIRFVPDSVEARHILLKPTGQASDTLLMAKLDSIKTVIENGGNFATIAKEESEDVASAIEGGNLGWFQQGVMTKPFNDACFYGKEGDITIVESQFGLHLIEIQKQAKKNKKVQLSTIVRRNVPSKETFDVVFAEASKFYANNDNAEAFKKATESEEYSKFIASEIKASDKDIPGMSNVRELVRWAFNNEKGAISQPQQFENTFIVAHLSEIKEKGTATFEQVEIQVEIGAKKKKKAAMFIEEMKNASSLEDLATKLGTTVQSAADVNFAAYAIPSVGQELRISGMASTLKENQMSIPIEGNTGVFVIKVQSVQPAGETTDYSAIKTQLQQGYAANTRKVLDVLKEEFGVEDKRYKFY